jgi:hypothetical protein
MRITGKSVTFIFGKLGLSPPLMDEVTLEEVKVADIMEL